MPMAVIILPLCMPDVSSQSCYHIFHFSIEPEGWPGIQMEIPKSAGAKRFGAFRCSARDNETDITKKAVGILLPTSGRDDLRKLENGKRVFLVNLKYLAQVFPKQSTYRTNADVPLEMEVIQPRPKDYEELMWVQMSRELHSRFKNSCFVAI